MESVKPSIVFRDDSDGMWELHCPICDTRLENGEWKYFENGMKDYIINVWHHICPFCETPIDWSDWNLPKEKSELNTAQDYREYYGFDDTEMYGEKLDVDGFWYRNPSEEQE